MSEYSEKDLFPGGRQKKIKEYLLLRELPSQNWPNTFVRNSKFTCLLHNEQSRVPCPEK